MKFAIATDDGDNVAMHTGRCGGFVIFEAADGVAKHIEHRLRNEVRHGRHVHHDDTGDHEAHRRQTHAGLLGLLEDCSALVTGGMGRRLCEDLAQAGVACHICDVRPVADAAALFAAGELPQVAGACSHTDSGGR